jgi:uncharacterized membrane protein YbhN (UPF0104 family)
MALRDKDSATSGKAEAAENAVARIAAFAQTHRVILRGVGVAASVAIIGVSLFIFGRTLVKIDLAQFESAFRATGADQIFLAIGLACTSYLALTGYDALALRHLGARVPYPLTALASFTSYAISFTLGFPLVTGGAVRFWIYGPAGLSAGRIASLTVVAGITFWLGMGLVLATGFLFDASAIAEINQFPPIVNQAIGVALIGVLVAYLAWVARLRAQGRGVLLHFRLPGPLLTLGQTALGVIDVCAAAGALYALLPKGQEIGFLAFSALYSFAAMLGIASHSPGGLGVFEATMLKGVGGSPDQLLASLLLFRVIYYLVPFVLALALLGANEAVRRWRSLSEAIERARLDDD